MLYAVIALEYDQNTIRGVSGKLLYSGTDVEEATRILENAKSCGLYVTVTMETYKMPV